MNPKVWKACPDFPKHECSFRGDIRRKDGKPCVLFVLPCHNKPERKYYSIVNHYWGHVHRQVFKAFGPPNPDPARYCLVDHMDNNPLNNHISNLRWSNKCLNALNTDKDQSKGYSYYPNSNRVHKYKAHIKWMGSAITLDRFATAEEATACYLECKDWIQREYRTHRYQDKHLVWVFKIIKYSENFLPGADPDKSARASKQYNRRMTAYRKYIKRHQLG